MIACRTTIGFGAPTKAGKASSHGSPLGADEIKGAREKLGWNHPPFEIPADILELVARRRAALARPRTRPGTSASRRCRSTSAASSRAASTAICRSGSPTRCAA